MNRVIDTIPSATMDALQTIPVARKHPRTREYDRTRSDDLMISTGPVLSLNVADLKLPPASSSPLKVLQAKAFEEKAPAPDPKTHGALPDVVQETERQRILEALKQSNWVVAGPKGAGAQL